MGTSSASSPASVKTWAVAVVVDFGAVVVVVDFGAAVVVELDVVLLSPQLATSKTAATTAARTVAIQRILRNFVPPFTREVLARAAELR